MAINRWQDAVDATLNQVRRNRSTRLEWRKFTESKIKMLEDLSELPFPNFVQKYCENDGIKEATCRDKEFLKQCLNVCLEQTEKFWPFFLHLIEKTFDENELKFLLETIAIKLLEQEEAEYLHDVMSYFQEKCKKCNLIQKSLKKNSPILMYACSRDNFELVRVLVNHGCRLYTSHNLNNLRKVRKIPRIIARWRVFWILLTLF
jgi:hypothetical protein